MATTTCDCSRSNKLSDLEKAEIALQIASLTLGRILKDRALDFATSFLAFPDMAVKFADALVKSKNSNFAYSDMAEAAGALVALVAAGASLIGKANPLYNLGSTITQIAFLVNDALDSNSPLYKLLNQFATGTIDAVMNQGNDSDEYITGSKIADNINGSGGNDTIRGECGKDILYGGSGNDIIHGGDCDDTIYGDAGDDRLYGDTGNDKMYGGIGNDIIKGGSGNDTIHGGDGKDTLTGGTGADKFVISIADSKYVQDTITDFKHGIDKIGISGFSFDAQNFKDVTAGNQVRDIDDYILYNKSTGNLFYDSDGWDYENGRENGTGAKLIAHFDGRPTLTYSDFYSMFGANTDTPPSDIPMLPGITSGGTSGTPAIPGITGGTIETSTLPGVTSVVTLGGTPTTLIINTQEYGDMWSCGYPAIC